MPRRLLAALALSILAGCAGSPYDIAMKHRALDNYEGNDAGFMVGSIGIKSSNFSRSSVTFRRKNSEELVSLAYRPKIMLMGDKPDFENGIVIAKRLPPGEYELASANGEQYGTIEFRCRRPIQPLLTFTIQPGQVAYIGRYTLTSSRGSCQDVEISDEQKFDMTQAESRMKELPNKATSWFVPALDHKIW